MTQLEKFKADYRYQQAIDLWRYNCIIKDGYSLIDGVLVADDEL